MPSIKPLMTQGIKSYKAKDYSSAYKFFEEALRVFPTSDEYSSEDGEYLYRDTMRWKGLTEIKLGKLDKAVSTLEDLANRLNYDSPEVVYFLALAKYYYSYFLPPTTSKISTLTSALNGLRTVYSETSEYKSNFITLMALIYTELKEPDEAMDLLRLSKASGLVLKIAWAHVQRFMKNFNTAIMEIDKLLKHEPNNIDALLEKSLILKDQGDYSQCLVILDKVLKLEPTNVIAKLFKAEVLELTGKKGEALSLYSQLDKTLYSPLVMLEIKKLSVSSSPVSRILTPVKLTSWDPKVWIGKTLSIYEVKEILGEGGNGYVLKATAPGGEEVAIKILKIYSGMPEEYFDTLVNEANSLSSLSSNPAIVKIYAVYVDKLVIKEIMSGNLKFYERDPPRIVMEFMKGGTLSELLRDDNFFYSSKWNKTVYRAISTVVGALYQMHTSGFVHMDIKPQNIFLTEKPNCPAELEKVNFKLGDLGSAVRVGDKVTQLTVEYVSPEAYLETARPYFDIFSLGMTMYVLLTRKTDRPDLQEMEEAFKCYQKGDFTCVKGMVTKAQEKLKFWDPNVPQEVKPLIKSMTDPSPLRRPASAEVQKYLMKI
ncbi:protein kinase [Acidianus sp. HS-5]|uniref:protein kinase domain-containing protein n=1 Tax=Acidianus sp. HS-5 TaxID=2886040 RepID=UPI001EFF927C|nr:protein kinase [Acidianus sp. HS-5]BDC17543.1 hypothetical protein HS5_04330 [Acidianus sp. HS-5]